MSIRSKFAIFIFCLIALVIVGISINIFLVQRKLLREQLEQYRKKIFNEFCFACRESLIVKDELSVLNLTKSVIETHKPQILYAGYISPTGIKLLTAKDEDKYNEYEYRIYPSKIESVEVFQTSDGEIVDEFVRPLYNSNQEYLGTIKAGFSRSFLNQQIIQMTFSVGQRIFVISLVALGISLLMSNILALYLVKPIHALTKAAIELGSGKLDTKVEFNRKDELGQLGKTFNDMAEKLKQLDELKDSFVSSVSHELRSPLSAIDGYVDLLLESLTTGQQLDEEKQKKALSIIKDSVNRLTTFINNILDLAKIKAGRFEIHKVPVNVEEVVTEIVTLFQQVAIKQQKNLKTNLQAHLPPINADPERIKQVITNLVGNALKFTDAGAEIVVGARLVTEKILLGYGRRATDKEVPQEFIGKFVEIYVSDTGIGIPQNELDKIFDKFYQVGGSTAKKPKGTGLGLAIAAEIVKLHNGKIGVESIYGKGSTFKFCIPVWQQ